MSLSAGRSPPRPVSAASARPRRGPRLSARARGRSSQSSPGSPAAETGRAAAAPRPGSQTARSRSQTTTPTVSSSTLRWCRSDSHLGALLLNRILKKEQTLAVSHAISHSKRKVMCFCFFCPFFGFLNERSLFECVVFLFLVDFLPSFFLTFKRLCIKMKRRAQDEEFTSTDPEEQRKWVVLLFSPSLFFFPFIHTFLFQRADLRG